MRRLVCGLVMALIWGLLSAGSVPAQSQEITDLYKRVTALLTTGNNAEALPLAQRVLELTEKEFGASHRFIGNALNNLGYINRALQRFDEATTFYKRALAVREKAFGKDTPEVGEILRNLAIVYDDQGLHDKAEALYRRHLGIAEKKLPSEHVGIANLLSDLADHYSNRRLDKKAEPLYLRSLAIREKLLGPNHLKVASNLNNLAITYGRQGRHVEAEPLYRRSLAICEKALGREHWRVAEILFQLAGDLTNQGRYDEAEPLHQRHLKIWEKVYGSGHPRFALGLGGLARHYSAQSRFAEAEKLYRRSLAIRKNALGPVHLDVAGDLSTLGRLFRLQGRYAEAVQFIVEEIAILEKVLGPENPTFAGSLDALARLYANLGRLKEAERLFKRSLVISENVFGPEHEDFASSLGNLAILYQEQGRYNEAAPLHRRALAIGETVFGPRHPQVAKWLFNLAAVEVWQGRLTQAEAHLKRALAIPKQADGTEMVNAGARDDEILYGLAAIYSVQGKPREAEPLLRRALEMREKWHGPAHPLVAVVLDELASVYAFEKRYADAKKLYERSLEIRKMALGMEHPDVAKSLKHLGQLYFAQNNWGQAAYYLRRGTDLIARRSRHGAEFIGQGLGGQTKNEAARSGLAFTNLIKAEWRFVRPQSGGRQARLAEMIEAAQWGQGTEAASALARMAVRGAANDPRLAGIVRERQDLFGEWRRLDKLVFAAISKSPKRRNAEGESQLRNRLEAISKRISEIDARLANDFPNYAALANPVPLSVADIQAQLGNNEALVLFLDTPKSGVTPEETFIWVVTKGEARWVRSDVGTEALQIEVAALRCGLDYEGAWLTRISRCKELTGKTYTKADRRAGKPLPFDMGRAHSLYNALFGEIEDLIRDKHLLIVPSGPLTQLPFQVLVSAPPQSDVIANAAWLTHRNAITVLPAVSSLKSLRAQAQSSSAKKPFIGFGNPLLDGPDTRYNQLAKEARDRQQCHQTIVQRVASLLGFRGMTPIANPDIVRRATPLPETADELCRVADKLGAPASDIHLGHRASEASLKSMSDSGLLDDYRIVHFATHGAMAGELNANAEPGLILTPPKTASLTDDGYLSASEIAGLKLDADLVILSACNTAAGGKNNAEALSGLARAFFYAGARALLVSHWYVDSDATVTLVTNAFDALKTNPKIGRAEAMRRAMTALIKSGGRNAHPANWAPFVVVGEGGPRR